MDWWIWIGIGLVLLVIEVITPGGFFTVFFGAGALLVAALAGMGLLTSAAAQWATFGVSSTAALVFFRPFLRRWLSQHSARSVDRIEADVALAQDSIPPGARGKVELRGSPWTAHNTGHAAIAAGDRLRVRKVDGLTLHVEKEDS
jgi:membrane protein implicated in regulation of membrane protease activity